MISWLSRRTWLRESPAGSEELEEEEERSGLAKSEIDRCKYFIMAAAAASKEFWVWRKAA